MKQTSIMDSFLKKKPKEPRSQEPTPMKAEEKQVSSNTTSPNDKIIPEVKQDKQVNQFRQLISNGDFSYEKIIIGHSKKKKMEINDDDEPMRVQQKQEQFEDMLAEQKIKTKRKPGPMPSRNVSKNLQAQNFRKSVLMKDTNNEDQFSELTDVTPTWALPQHCRDANGNPPDHPDYDSSTLYIPPNALKDLTETMKQYWRLKAENYDKIVFFKLGKFYQLFYQDALVANRSFDLKWMGTKMHVGFPERCLEMYLYKFVQIGHKIVVIEQMETPDQMKERLGKDKSLGKRGERTLQRSVTDVVSKGTIVSSFLDQNQYLPNYLIAVFKQGNYIGYSLLEMGTNLIMVGLSHSVEDFKTILFQTRPVQLLYDPDNLPFDIVELMKVNWLNMSLSKLPNRDNIWHPLNSKNQIERLVSSEVFPMPAIFQALEKMSQNKDQIIYSALSGMFKYLKQMMKFDFIMSAVRFAFYETEGSNMTMVMDSQALQHLEVFETPLGEKGSLFERIDRTKTKFGRRLFRRWVMQPLLDPVKINQRLDAVQDLEYFHLDRNRVADVFSKLPDLQKIINRLYHYSVKTAAQKAIHFEDVSGSRMREFKDLMDHLTKSWFGLQILRKNKDKFKSERLRKLLTIAKENTNQDQDQDQMEGLLPRIRQQLAELEATIKWDNNVPKPQPGLIESYDMLEGELSNIKANLEQYLDNLRRQTGVSILKYVHTKERYEIEFPDELEKKRPHDSIFTSKKIGYSRFITPETKKMVEDLEYVQGHIKQQMGLFVGHFFQEFRKFQKTWQKYVEILAQLDCLISMSIMSTQIQGNRPTFTSKGFNIINAKHPCLTSINMIPNDIDLNSKVMLLTGPNMGGKSTLLRTTCLSVIMAQVGLYVPAESYECQIIDRIFTRIGASDKLEEGKSTFFIEMEETKSIIKYGTRNSLAIIDELGRGTSTFDGMAIAYSVLRSIIQRVQCRCLFATHYHNLSKEFEGLSEVKMKMMDSIISNGKVVFLYKLKDGKAEQSFGLNVARMVKLPQKILQIAENRTKYMQEEIKQKEKYRKFREAMTFAYK